MTLQKRDPSANALLQTDEDLVALCTFELPYNTQSFEILVRRHEAVIFRTCVRYLRNEDDAEEATQDVFLRAFHHIERFRGQSAFRTWLFRIAANVCASRYRRRQANAEREAEYAVMAHLLADMREPLLDFLDFGDGPLANALDSLETTDREMLILRHVIQLTFQEIAESFEISLSAAKMRLYRAEEKLRAIFAGPKTAKPKK
jgi:RNA polymerase sigma-70 factor (ECF subfamily)